MATENIGWAPSDIWFTKGFAHLQTYSIEEDTVIQILPVAYFLATKFSAHKDRGTDPRTSKDFEDIIYIIDNHQNIVAGIKEAPADVNSFLKKELKELLREDMEEAVLCHLNPFGQIERFNIIINKIKEIVK